MDILSTELQHRIAKTLKGKLCFFKGGQLSEN